MKVKELIILAGGFGTRLQSVVQDAPKCLAPVNKKPFLHYIIDIALAQGIEQFVFALGYKKDMVIDFVQQQYPYLQAQFSIEDIPAGTGGAIQMACAKAKQETILVCNGDTLFDIDISALSSFHATRSADCSLALKPMKYPTRYGTVELDATSSITAFKEKAAIDEGLINGGIYMLEAKKFLQEAIEIPFSFEKDYLEKMIGKRKLYGQVQDKYFIDIGIPEDYARAQNELKKYDQQL